MYVKYSWEQGTQEYKIEMELYSSYRLLVLLDLSREH